MMAEIDQAALTELRSDAVELNKTIAEAEDKLKALREQVQGIVPEQRETLRVKYADRGEWARHYSNVRMTVTPFLILVAAGIVQFQWNDFSLGWLATAAAVWLVAFVLFMWATHDFVKMFNEQRDADDDLTSRKTARTRMADGPFCAMWILTAIFIVSLVFWWRSGDVEAPGVPSNGESEEHVVPAELRSEDKL